MYFLSMLIVLENIKSWWYSFFILCFLFVCQLFKKIKFSLMSLFFVYSRKLISFICICKSSKIVHVALVWNFWWRLFTKRQFFLLNSAKLSDTFIILFFYVKAWSLRQDHCNDLELFFCIPWKMYLAYSSLLMHFLSFFNLLKTPSMSFRMNVAIVHEILPNGKVAGMCETLWTSVIPEYALFGDWCIFP